MTKPLYNVGAVSNLTDVFFTVYTEGVSFFLFLLSVDKLYSRCGVAAKSW